MPLGKKRNRDRMRQLRANKLLNRVAQPHSTSQDIKHGQPNVMKAVESMVMPDYNDKFHCGELEIDADGQIISEY